MIPSISKYNFARQSKWSGIIGMHHMLCHLSNFVGFVLKPTVSGLKTSFVPGQFQTISVQRI
jgi:hypothetical protein